jgi:hypothetical protein
MFHVKPFVQFNLRLDTELAEVLAAMATDVGMKPSKMLSRIVTGMLEKKRGEFLLTARAGPAVGTRKERAAQALSDLAVREMKESAGKAFDAAFAAAEVLPPDVEETTEEPDFKVLGVDHHDESRDCPAAVGAYRCLLPIHSDDVGHQWGR